MRTARISQGVSIVDIDNLMGGSYDENRAPHTGVFTGCLGDYVCVYAGEEWDIRVIEDLILEEYAPRSIGFMTWQEFAHHLKTTWNRYIFPLFEIMRQQPALTLSEETEQTTADGKITVDMKTETNNTVNGTDTLSQESTGKETGKGMQKLSNTPNQYLSDPSTFNGLSGYQESDGSRDTEQKNDTTNATERISTGEALTTGTNTSDRTIKREKSRNAFEKWLFLSEINRNIIYDFVDKFEPLFSTTSRITF